MRIAGLTIIATAFLLSGCYSLPSGNNDSTTSNTTSTCWIKST